MDTMDYSYFASAPQPYQYLGYGADAGLLTGVSRGSIPTPVSRPTVSLVCDSKY